jgi:phosphate transport system substrate-binding protein
MLRALLFTILALCAGVADAETLTLAGSTTFNAHFMVPYQSEIEALSGHKLIVLPNRTNLGLKLLFEGRADLAMISASLEATLPLIRRTDPELPLAQLRSFEVYRTRVAFAVHASNPVRFLNAEQIRRVLLGEINNWREIGGPDLSIRVVMVREGGGVQLVVEEQLLGGKLINVASPIRVQIASRVNQVVAQEPAALGLAQVENLKGHHVFELVTPHQAMQHLSLVSLGEPTGAMQAVIDAARNVGSKKSR